MPVLSEAVKAVIETFTLFEGDVALNELTVGLPVSTATLAGEPYTAETFPNSSFAHGYRVYTPSLATLYVAGAEPVQPGAAAEGAVPDSVIKYPLRVESSVAMNSVIGMSRLFDADGTLKDVTVGAAVSSTSTAIRSALALPLASVNSPPA